MTDEFLRLERIHKSFVGVHALKGVDFALRKGEIHCLVGENGSGKSTLIKIISGVLQPDSGQITVEGQRVDHLGSAATLARGIQVIYQDLSLFPNLTVAENIALSAAKERGGGIVNWREVRSIARAAMDRIQVDIDLDAEVGELPIGLQQLVAICRALTGDTKLLILDEPTASLPKHDIDSLFAVVRDLQAHGVSQPVRGADDKPGWCGSHLRRRRRLVGRGRGEHAAHRLLTGHVAPAAVHPQPELRISPHVHLEHVRAALRELLDRLLVVGRRRLDRVLVHHPEAAARQRQREDRDDGRARPQRERRQRGRRRRGTVEEIDVDRVGRLHVLIDQKRDRLVRLERPQAPGGWPPGGRSPSCRCAVRTDSSRSCRSGLSSGRASTAIGWIVSACTSALISQNPKCPVNSSTPRPCAWAWTTRSSPSNSTHASIRSGRMVLNFSSTASSRPKCENISRAIARHSGSGPHGKRRAQVLDRETPVAAIEQVEGAPEQRAGREHGADGKQADDRDHADHGQVLQPVPERRPRTRRRRACGAMLVSQR